MTDPAAPGGLPRLTAEAVSDETLTRAATALRSGALVAFPTETVYGLGADACAEPAVAAIFAAKGRPAFNPLIVHVADRDGLAGLIAPAGPMFERLTDAFWPGPLTLVVPRAVESPLAAQVSAGRPTVAVRAPAHPVARALLRAAAIPVAAPSANRSGAVSPTTASHVVAEFSAGTGPRPSVVLDGGPCPVGLESTVLDLSGEGPVLLRPGSVTREALERVLGRSVTMPTRAHEEGGAEGAAPAAPGMLSSHYAPRLPVRLNAVAADPGELLLGFGGTPGAALDLSPRGDLEEAARNLFAMLRRLDDPAGRGIAVAPVPQTGLGLAINDRLTRAAAPRSAAGVPDRPSPGGTP